MPLSTVKHLVMIRIIIAIVNKYLHKLTVAIGPSSGHVVLGRPVVRSGCVNLRIKAG